MIRKYNVYDSIWNNIKMPMCEHEYQGKFITFDGIDGSGKSTLLNMVFDYLTFNKIKCFKTFTPCKEIRELSYWKEYADPKTDRSNFDPFGLDMIAFADRMIFQNRILEPLLASSVFVLCDRYILNSLVYNQHEIFLKLLPNIIKPDLGIVVTTDIVTVNSRIAQRGEVENKDDIEEKRIISDRYIELAKSNQYFVVDTSNCLPDESFEKIRPLVDKLIWTYKTTLGEKI